MRELSAGRRQSRATAAIIRLMNEFTEMPRVLEKEGGFAGFLRRVWRMAMLKKGRAALGSEPRDEKRDWVMGRRRGTTRKSRAFRMGRGIPSKPGEDGEREWSLSRNILGVGGGIAARLRRGEYRSFDSA